MTAPGVPLAAALVLTLAAADTSAAQDAPCPGYGPQAPRDITVRTGENGIVFATAPPARAMNLCNIHTHTFAEHRGPGFRLAAMRGPHGGFRCNGTEALTEAERADPGPGAYGNVTPGDTIEVHWVYTTCDVSPGPGLDACSSAACANPQLRVEAQVFLLVNDPAALDFRDFAYAGPIESGRHQPRALPSGTGEPVVFAGSTTGPTYSNSKCSPLGVTWSVRPQCAKLHIGSLNAWAEDNVFQETQSHGVRPLVTAPELLAPIP